MTIRDTVARMRAALSARPKFLAVPIDRADLEELFEYFDAPSMPRRSLGRFTVHIEGRSDKRRWVIRSMYATREEADQVARVLNGDARE